MGAFELNNESTCGETNNLDQRRLREECIIALKAYDFCRQQDCLTSDVLGPARAYKCGKIGDEIIEEGDVINPPSNAASVTIEGLRVKKVLVADKEPSPFRNGFWDITLKYVFVYKLIFRESDTSFIGSILASSVFTKRVTLFGSIGTDITISSDLFCHGDKNDSFDLDSDPFVLVESKAVALSAELGYRDCCCSCDDVPEANRVDVTIGLFTIIKLFRIVNLSVQSRGFCIPDECEETSAINPCDFFDNLDFPMDIFAPPQRPEFVAGISSNIPHKPNTGNTGNTGNCCGNNNGNCCGCSNNCGCGN